MPKEALEDAQAGFVAASSRGPGMLLWRKDKMMLN